MADQGSEVDIQVSSGPATVKVPDVTGQSEASAAANLAAPGFMVTTANQSSTTVPSGQVIGTNPSAGIQVAPKSTDHDHRVDRPAGRPRRPRRPVDARPAPAAPRPTGLAPSGPERRRASVRPCVQGAVQVAVIGAVGRPGTHSLAWACTKQLPGGPDDRPHDRDLMPARPTLERVSRLADQGRAPRSWAEQVAEHAGPGRLSRHARAGARSHREGVHRAPGLRRTRHGRCRTRPRPPASRAWPGRRAPTVTAAVRRSAARRDPQEGRGEEGGGEDRRRPARRRRRRRPRPRRRRRRRPRPRRRAEEGAGQEDRGQEPGEKSAADLLNRCRRVGPRVGATAPVRAWGGPGRGSWRPGRGRRR